MFAFHLTEVFKPHSSSSNLEEAEILDYLQSLFQMSRPIVPFTAAEMKDTIQHFNPKKAPGYDEIINKVIKELPRKEFSFLTSIFHAILRLGYYPKSWKRSLNTLSYKLGKPIHKANSYRPIILLSNFSKQLEKITYQTPPFHTRIIEDYSKPPVWFL